MISVVIPCYNATPFVGRAIRSVLIQDYQDWEIILVDNNSTDRTMETLLGYQKEYPDRIKVFEENKKGGCAARNKGLKEASGEWIQFLDADDELLPSKFSRQLKILKEQAADFIAGNFARVITIKGRDLKFIKGVGERDYWAALISAKLGITSANLFSSEKLRMVNGWDEQLSSSQEYDMMFRLMVNGAKPAFDKQLSALIYYEGNSVSRSKNADKNISMSENYVNLRMRIRQFLQHNGLMTRERNMLIGKLSYAYLLDKRNIIPGYVNKKLQELDLHIAWWQRLTIKLRITGKHFIKKLSTGR